MTNNNQIEDQMALFSQLYPGVYTPIPPASRESKPRRRRRKNKGGDASGLMGAKKRKLSTEQVTLLEESFGNEHKLESDRKDRLASELGLDPRQVAVWFQNRRARWKSKKLEEEYSKLKSLHEAAIVEKCRLETEVLKLKEQLSEAGKEIQKLSSISSSSSSSDHQRCCDHQGFNSSNSPSTSSISMDRGQPDFLGDFGYEDDVMFYMPENSYSVQCMEWLNLYM
ncbi:hypothetical protein CDL15_Pgr005110 [Punica granatum]|nr:hypothetical protein CDL15_Pgr005110 [Punica granatum]